MAHVAHKEHFRNSAGPGCLGARLEGFDDRSVTVDDGRPPCGIGLAVGGIRIVEGTGEGGAV